uniref:ATP synthase F0 subunit 8 n=1 Tax=Marophrys sp. SRT127 TaxID=2488311 RepID=A0A455REB1_9EUKA|nr:ATP synthase F0 subunit 8 [Marophrys sp. SRT127]
MPQFDITSFYPQISFFAGIYLILYVFLAKNILPRISQNLKLGKKITEVYNSFSATVAGKGSKDINFLSHIYNPSLILSHSIYKETLCLIYLQKFSRVLTTPFAAACNWRAQVKDHNSRIALLKLNRVYLHTLNEIYHPSSATSSSTR